MVYALPAGPDGSFALSTNYARTDEASIGPFGFLENDSQVISGTATYSRHLTDRLSAFVSPSFSISDNPGLGRRENYEVSIGITHRFGRLQ